ncbi:uncharacterized protein METZ01_LOCUS119693 [marine metagenome]|uniref:Uncharacterized protein n=1 Tax=marine metagenome TaxID=408172 RepID=A0A381XQ06_9ZZZZ
MAPAAIPLTIYFSKKMQTTTRGAIEAPDNAAIDHQFIPCDPVCEATITGRVLASVLVKRAANKYSFQHKTRDKINAETIPGRTIGNTILLKDPQTVSPSTSAASSNSIGTALN